MPTYEDPFHIKCRSHRKGSGDFSYSITVYFNLTFTKYLPVDEVLLLYDG
jgi:hypothetical protein